MTKYKILNRHQALYERKELHMVSFKGGKACVKTRSTVSFHLKLCEWSLLLQRSRLKLSNSHLCSL